VVTHVPEPRGGVSKWTRVYSTTPRARLRPFRVKELSTLLLPMAVRNAMGRNALCPPRNLKRHNDIQHTVSKWTHPNNACCTRCRT
jgi:hypothetical protein